MSDSAIYVQSLARALRRWTYTFFMRTEVVAVMVDAGLSEDDATAVLSVGIEGGILRQDGGIIRVNPDAEPQGRRAPS